MKAVTDSVVWDYAKKNDLMIVSKDADMHDFSLVFGTIHLKLFGFVWETVRQNKLKIYYVETSRQ